MVQLLLATIYLPEETRASSHMAIEMCRESLFVQVPVSRFRVSMDPAIAMK
jgi:hypothetical protein